MCAPPEFSTVNTLLMIAIGQEKQPQNNHRTVLRVSEPEIPEISRKSTNVVGISSPCRTEN